jgi:hypothetical protein
MEITSTESLDLGSLTNVVATFQDDALTDRILNVAPTGRCVVLLFEN